MAAIVGLVAILAPLAVCAVEGVNPEAAAPPRQVGSPKIAPDQPRPLPFPGPLLVSPSEAPETKLYNPDCGKPQDDKDANYCLQKQSTAIADKSAKYAKSQADSAFWGLIFVCLAFFASLWAAVATHRGAASARISAQEARNATAIARNAFENEQRAWLRVTAQIQQAQLQENNYLGAMGIFEVENIGNSPARNFSIHLEAVIETNSGLDIIDSDFGLVNEVYNRIFKSWLDAPVNSGMSINFLVPGGKIDNFGVRPGWQMFSREGSYLICYGVTYNDGVSDKRRLTASVIQLTMTGPEDGSVLTEFSSHENGNFSRAAVVS